MKQKVYFLFFFLLFFLFFLGYIYLSLMNSDYAKLYIGRGRYYEMSVANYVAASFVLGAILSIIASFFTEISRGVATWQRKRDEKRTVEVRALFDKAKIYDLKGEPEKAAEYAQRVIRTFPDLEEPHMFLAEMHIARNEFDKANQVLDNAQALFGIKESILFKRVAVARASRDTDSTERHLRELLRINETNLQAQNMLRDVLVSRRQWTEALEIEKKIRKQIKTAGENHYLVGLQYEKAKELLAKGDERTYEQLVKDIKEITDGNKGFIPGYLLAAEVYRKMGKLNDAGRVYGRGFSKTGHVIFLQKMEEFYIQRGEPAAVLKIYRRLIEVAPRNQFLIFLYARLCLKLEMIDEAIDLLNSLMAEEREFQGIHRAMAEAYIHRGEYGDAAKEFARAFPISKAYLPFYCEKCQSVKEEWADFCESCHSWNTVNVRQEGLFQKEADNLRILYEHDQDLEAS
jgi:tetratricopeptide (TPR) repeat protein